MNSGKRGPRKSYVMETGGVEAAHSARTDEDDVRATVPLSVPTLSFMGS